MEDNRTGRDIISAKRRRVRDRSPPPRAKTRRTRGHGGPADELSGNATSSRICCCARPRSSSTTGSHRARAAGAGRDGSRRSARRALPLVDDLERALQADTGSEGAEAYRRGVELIHRQLMETLRNAASGRSRPWAPISIRTVIRRSARGGARPSRRRSQPGYRGGYTLGDRLPRASTVKAEKGEA